MTKLILALLAGGSALALHAQLPYTSTTAVPGHISREYEVHETDSVPRLELQFEGTGILWDLSDWRSPVPMQELWYFEPASGTPYFSTYPTANVVARYTDVFGSTHYQYFNNSPFELRLLGGVFVDASGPQYIPFCPDPFLIMDYPMTMGSGVQHVYDCPGGPGDTHDWVIKGTGSVQVEDQLMENLVLWRTIYTGFGNTFQDTAYFWTQADNVLYPVVRYHPAGGVVKIRIPFETVELNTGEMALPQILLHPNPVSDVLTVEWPSAGLSLTAVIMDASGRRIIELGDRTFQGAERIDVKELGPGIYFLEMRSASGLMRREKFIKN
jgi:hypothetical protein